MPVQEKIRGVKSHHKKALKKCSLCYVYDTFLFRPIKAWSYVWGNRYYDQARIKKSIVNINNKYAFKLAKAINEKTKKTLILRRDKLIAKKQYQLEKGNMLMQLGSKPIYYYPGLDLENKKIFLKYLESIGYFDAEIESKVDFLSKKVRITYTINPNNVYRIASNQLKIQDATISALLVKHEKESFIKANDVYRYQNFCDEQNRIVTLLAHNGYFQFNEQYIHFLAEIDKAKSTIAITTIVDQPSNAKYDHQQMYIADVIVYLRSQEELQENNLSLSKISYHGVSFVLPSKKIFLKDLVHKIAIRSGDLYDRSKIAETCERLYQTDLFESVNILPKVESGKLRIYIYAKPYKHLTFQVEAGGEFLNLDIYKLCPIIKIKSTVRQLLDGISSISVEGNFAWRFKHYKYMNKYIDSNVNLRLFMPRCLLYLPDAMHKRIAKFKPSTTFLVKYGLLDDPMHNSEKVDVLLEYGFYSAQKNMSCSLYPVKIAFISPVIKQKNPDDLQFYFYTAIGVSTMFKKISIQNWLNYKWIVSMGLEGGGVYEYLFKLYKFLPKDIALPKYVKFDFSYQYVFSINRDAVVVSHAKFGLLIPNNDRIIDLAKQYQAGGHGYVRAWDINMLGPGCYNLSALKSYKGNLLLLSNIELRHKLIGYFEGAIFLDIGNTWKLSKTAPLVMQFHFKNFYQLLALAGGFGLRFNFKQIFVICADLAFRLRQPSGKVLPWSERCSLNFNIGYPF